MTEQQINETIATLNGWRKYTSPAAGDLQWFSPDGFQHIAPPRYTKDLNEVALLEATMSSTLLKLYIDNLCEMCTDGWDPDITELVTMDAESKCVAYLRAVGKWEE
jgi:hypothetical protein